ncbi:MAG: hypothetical protein ACRCYB_12745 [Aeromonas veronii]
MMIYCDGLKPAKRVKPHEERGEPLQMTAWERADLEQRVAVAVAAWVNNGGRRPRNWLDEHGRIELDYLIFIQPHLSRDYVECIGEAKEASKRMYRKQKPTITRYEDWRGAVCHYAI